jgi:hypothetical protein
MASFDYKLIRAVVDVGGVTHTGKFDIRITGFDAPFGEWTLSQCDRSAVVVKRRRYRCV